MIEQQLFNEACQTDLNMFMRQAFSILEPAQEIEWGWHIECIAEHLMASYRGEIPRLIINIPPRCLKSVSVAQIYPAWVLGNKPSEQFIGASYAHSLAERNVRYCRNIINDEWYRQCFPDMKISDDQNQKDYFTTTHGGQYKGTGIGGTITGFGASTLLVDDPISPSEGASQTIRNSANQAIRSTLFSRFNDKRTGKLIMIMQRVHDDDPTGNLERDGGYHVVKLPAETKTQVLITLGKKKWEMNQGDLLTARLPKSALDELRIDLGEYNYAGQYLQSPVPLGGGEFKHEWVMRYDTVSAKTMNVFILCDPAGGDEVNKRKKKTSDFSAFAVIGLGQDNNYYLLDMVRDRLNPTERVEMLFVLHRKWNEKAGKPPKVGYEKYGMMTDTHYIKQRQGEENYRFPIVELGGQMMKEERIRRMIPDLQRGRWWFPSELNYIDCEGRKIDLMKELVDGEMPTFPKARFDDMLDSISRIYDNDVAAVFPQIKVKSAYQRETNDSWENW